MGIHLVCCTQRLDAEAVRGQLKVNVDGTVALRVRVAIKSSTLFDGDKSALARRIRSGRFEPVRPSRRSRRSTARWKGVGSCR